MVEQCNRERRSSVVGWRVIVGAVLGVLVCLVLVHIFTAAETSAHASVVGSVRPFPLGAHPGYHDHDHRIPNQARMEQDMHVDMDPVTDEDSERGDTVGGLPFGLEPGGADVAGVPGTYDAHVEVSAAVNRSCREPLRRLLADARWPRPFAFLHLTKAGGSAVERWVERARVRDSGSHHDYFAREVSAVRKLPPHSHHAAVLREPLARLASYLDYRRYDVRAKYRKQAREQWDSMVRFGEVYAKVLTNQERGDKPLGRPCEEAVARLHSMAVVGTSERLLEWSTVLAFALGWEEAPPLERVNVQEGAPGVAGLSRDVRKAAPQHNRCDARLHAEAGRLLDADVQCLGAPFQRYLAAARAAHRLHATNQCVALCVPYGTAHNHGTPVATGP